MRGDKYRCAECRDHGARLRIRRLGDSHHRDKTRDGYRLSGVKGLIPLAAQCSHFLVIARCDGALDAFIVDRNARGVSVGEKKPNIGLRALETATVSFKDVELSAGARLGESAGCDVQRIIDSARTALSAIMTGISRGVMEFVIPYLKERVVHGAPLAQKQVIAFRLADMRIETDAMRWMTWKAASILEQGGDATQAGAARVHLCRRAGDVDRRRRRADARRPWLPAR